MAQSGAHGGMNIQDQRETFHGFLTVAVWSCVLLAQGLALATLAFAIGAGWWPGLFAFAAIGVALGLVCRMPGTYWAMQVVLLVLLGVGGIIAPLISGAMG